MCIDDDKTSNPSPSCIGWVDYTIESPSDGPLPPDWPSVTDMKELLTRAAVQWDSSNFQPPSQQGVLLPPGYPKKEEDIDVAIERFTKDWRDNLRSFGCKNQPYLHPSAKDDLRQFLETNKSGVEARLLKIEVLILPKGRVFGAHAHPTIELECTLRGALGEVRLVSSSSTKELEVPCRGPWSLSSDLKSLVGPNLQQLDDKYKNLPTTAIWKRSEPVHAGKYLFNEVGSIHKSYTVSEEHGAFLCLWGGIHAKILPEEEGTLIPNSHLLSCDFLYEDGKGNDKGDKPLEQEDIVLS